jgi:predicted MPP superfamily phosphohydrolase
MWNLSSSRKQRAAAKLPDGQRIYAIGDVHGRADLLKALFLQIEVDCKLYPSRMVLVGDYIDRGPASREVLDLLLGCEQTRETVFLKGNHDTFVHRFMSKPAVLDEWRLWGASKLLCPTGSSHRSFRTLSNKNSWPDNWPDLSPNGICSS